MLTCCKTYFNIFNKKFMQLYSGGYLMLRLYLYPILIILSIVATLFPNQALYHFIGITANITIIISLFYARGLYLYSGIIF